MFRVSSTVVYFNNSLTSKCGLNRWVRSFQERPNVNSHQLQTGHSSELFLLKLIIRVKCYRSTLCNFTCSCWELIKNYSQFSFQARCWLALSYYHDSLQLSDLKYRKMKRETGENVFYFNYLQGKVIRKGRQLGWPS